MPKQPLFHIKTILENRLIIQAISTAEAADVRVQQFKGRLILAAVVQDTLNIKKEHLVQVR